MIKIAAYKGERNRQFPSKISTTQFVKLYILHLLIERSYYGNELIDEIKKRMNYKWEPSPGMIYPLLRELESNNYIKGWWEEPDKRSIRHYRITDDGLDNYKKTKLLYKPAIDDSLTIIQNTLKDIYGYI
ncbi:PadR family transcriptional regulator [Alkaliphilus sp. B6464]|uniref:PadR family transcriptional regulator n=1 Tax=Alkaliphilus sp. B6464 TaxID=2731219 RepID=UPI00201237EE|nr:PadR family transcriptional regulator [Alkaliphilus sp. B6464]